MNPLRVVGEWLLGRTEPIHRIPFENDGAGFYASSQPTGGQLPPGIVTAVPFDPGNTPTEVSMAPLGPEWRHLMGRGGADCHVRDHHDALRRLGHTLTDLDHLHRKLEAVTADRDEALIRATDAERRLARVVFDRDTWRERALRAEGKLAPGHAAA